MRTITYIEDHIMSDSGDSSEDLLTYLFIWDRFRMVAKDFTLQLSGNIRDLPLWVECHERMARWFVLMEQRMRTNGTLT